MVAEQKRHTGPLVCLCSCLVFHCVVKNLADMPGMGSLGLARSAIGSTDNSTNSVPVALCPNGGIPTALVRKETKGLDGEGIKSWRRMSCWVLHSLSSSQWRLPKSNSLQLMGPGKGFQRLYRKSHVEGSFSITPTIHITHAMASTLQKPNVLNRMVLLRLSSLSSSGQELDQLRAYAPASIKRAKIDIESIAFFPSCTGY